MRSRESRRLSRIPRSRPKRDGEDGGKPGALDTPGRFGIATGSRQGFECFFGSVVEDDAARLVGAGMGLVVRVSGGAQRSCARVTRHRGRSGWSGGCAHRGSGCDGAGVGGSLRAGSDRRAGRVGWSGWCGPGPKMAGAQGPARGSCHSRVIRRGGPSSLSREIGRGSGPRPSGGAEGQAHPLRRPGRPSLCWSRLVTRVAVTLGPWLLGCVRKIWMTGQGCRSRGRSRLSVAIEAQVGGVTRRARARSAHPIAARVGDLQGDPVSGQEQPARGSWNRRDGSGRQGQG